MKKLILFTIVILTGATFAQSIDETLQQIDALKKEISQNEKLVEEKIADLNRENYQNGDEMIINISSSKDCYVYVFNILSDETVSALLPNQYLEENYLAKGKSIRVPPEKGKITKFRVDLPEGKSQATEMILVLGIKADKNTKSKDFDLNIGDYKMALTQLMEFIMGFPRDRVEQVNLPYVIQKKEK